MSGRYFSEEHYYVNYGIIFSLKIFAISSTQIFVEPIFKVSMKCALIGQWNEGACTNHVDRICGIFEPPPPL